jgi:hypothetical protein
MKESLFNFHFMEASSFICNGHTASQLLHLGARATHCAFGEMTTGATIACKKRKRVSDAEKIAVSLSKLILKHVHPSKFKFENERIFFLETARTIFTDTCTWRENKTCPCYCKKAQLKFEAYLPDRKFLTRYSVQCPSCYSSTESAVHLYCSYCDEILTGSIAGPGGKITDHLITIRHVYQEAVALRAFFEQRGIAREQDRIQAREYVAKLEEWSETIRYPMRNSVKRMHFEEVLKDLRFHLSKTVRPCQNNQAERTNWVT